MVVNERERAGAVIALQVRSLIDVSLLTQHVLVAPSVNTLDIERREHVIIQESK